VFASFCGKNDLHFISDEIYAFSVFPNSAIPTPTPFTSILALDLVDVINPLRMHVLYGASKVFCAHGLRMGFVHTNNEGTLGAMSSIGYVATVIPFYCTSLTLGIIVYSLGHLISCKMHGLL
jgi:aspartate/methionine/tyrosine aminotransferase